MAKNDFTLVRCDSGKLLLFGLKSVLNKVVPCGIILNSQIWLLVQYTWRLTVADPGGLWGIQSNPPLAHSLVWKIPIWTFTFAQKYLSGNLRTPTRTPLHRILDPPQGSGDVRHDDNENNFIKYISPSYQKGLPTDSDVPYASVASLESTHVSPVYRYSSAHCSHNLWMKVIKKQWNRLWRGETDSRIDPLHECSQSGGQNKRNFRFCKKILFCTPAQTCKGSIYTHRKYHMVTAKVLVKVWDTDGLQFVSVESKSKAGMITRVTIVIF